MRVEQLRYFLKILELGSFRQAADDLHMSQPALSESLKSLERELGAQLMERSRRGVRLTTVGQSVLPYVKAMIDAEAALKTEVDALRGLHRGQVRIGTTNAGSNTVLPWVLNRFHDRFPGVQIQVTETGSLNIEQHVKNGDFDIGLVVSVAGRGGDDTIAGQQLLTSPMVVCVPQGHHLLERPTVTPADVAEEPLILFRSGYFMHDLAFEILGRDELNVVYFTDNTESVKRMVVAGIGITILPLFSVYPDVLTKDGEISYIPLTGDLTTLSLNVIRRRRGYASRAVRELWSDLVAEAARASASGRHVAPNGR